MQINLALKIRHAAAWIVRLELWLLAVATPLLMFPNRWTPIGVTLIALTWLCRRVARGRFTLRTAMDVPIAILVLMALVSFSVSVDPAMSRAKLWGIVLQAAIFYGMVNGLRNERQILQMAGILVVVTIGVALVSLVGTDWDVVRLVDLPLVYDRLPRLIRGVPGSGVPRASDLFHPREVGATMGMLLPVPVALLLFGQHRGLKILSGVAVAVAGVTFLLAQSLQALLGFGMALLLIAAWRSRWALLSIPLGVMALAVGLLACGPRHVAISLLSVDDPLGIGVALRLDIWSRALAMVHDMPYTGIGLNTFPVIQTQFYPGFLLGPEVHAHNLFLHTAVDLGLPGLGALLWLLAAFYLMAIRAYRSTSNRDLRVLLVGLAAGVLAYMGHGLPDTITLGARPVAALFDMMGMAAAVLRHGDSLGQGDKVRGRQGARETFSLSPGLLVALSPHRSTQLAVGLLLGLLLLSAITFPAAPYLNLGAIRAHRALLAARTTGSPQKDVLQAAVGPLHQALARDPDNVYACDLLGSLYAWQGDCDAAIEAFVRRVELDGQDPVARYAPFEALRRRIQGEAGHDRWDDVLRVYSQWMARFPDRAETYVQAAIVWHRYRGDRTRAAAVLRSGLDHGAQPRGLLSCYLSQIEQSR